MTVGNTQIIKSVIKKMRYRKKVRAEVLAELVSDFESELKDFTTEEEREAKAQQLIEDFGDAKLLGRLLRRAKKRCRPLWRTIVARTFQTVGVLVLCLGASAQGGVEYDVTWVSKYIWWGFDLLDDKAATQQSLNFDFGSGFSGTFLTSYAGAKKEGGSVSTVDATEYRYGIGYTMLMGEKEDDLATKVSFMFVYRDFIDAPSKAFDTEELAEWHQDHLDEGWGESCTGTIVVKGQDLSCEELQTKEGFYLELLLDGYGLDVSEELADFVKQFFPNGLPTFTVQIFDEYYYSVSVRGRLVHKAFAYPEERAEPAGVTRLLERIATKKVEAYDDSE